MSQQDDDKADELIQKLLADAESDRLKKKVVCCFQDLIIVIMCVELLRKTKHNPELYKAAKKKVRETLEKTEMYKSYIKIQSN